MPIAKKLPSGNWRCRVYIGKDENGKDIYRSVTAPTKNKAEAKANQIARSKKKRQSTENLTLTEAIDEYIKLKENILSPETVRGYLVIQRNRFPALMNVRLKSIDSQKVQRAINEDAKVVSEKTIRNALGLVKVILKTYAPENEIDVDLPQREKKEKNILNLDQTALLLRAIEGDRAEIPILLAMWLGMRASEIRGIKWSAYDREKKTLTVRETLVKDRNNALVAGKTKTTDSRRSFKLPDYICAKLDALHETRGEHCGEYIIDLPYHTEYKRLQIILRKNDLPHICFHDLRHLNASFMLLLGIPQKYAMERGGWSSPRTMQNVYQHVFAAERENVDDRVNTFFEDLLSKKYDTKV